MCLVEQFQIFDLLKIKCLKLQDAYLTCTKTPSKDHFEGVLTVLNLKCIQLIQVSLVCATNKNFYTSFELQTTNINYIHVQFTSKLAMLHYWLNLLLARWNWFIVFEKYVATRTFYRQSIFVGGLMYKRLYAHACT